MPDPEDRHADLLRRLDDHMHEREDGALAAENVDWSFYHRQLIVAAVGGYTSCENATYFIPAEAVARGAIEVADAVVAKLRARS